MKFELQTWKSVFTNVRYRSWSSKPFSINAALVITFAAPPQLQQKIATMPRIKSFTSSTIQFLRW